MGPLTGFTIGTIDSRIFLDLHDRIVGIFSFHLECTTYRKYDGTNNSNCLKLIERIIDFEKYFYKDFSFFNSCKFNLYNNKKKIIA